MEYVTVRNLEKYHPGYKDRHLVWGKICFTAIAGDPDWDLIENEVDKWRLVGIILLELKAKRPLPNDDAFWKKYFNIDNRPMSLTLQMLQNFISSVTEESKVCSLEKSRIEKNRIDKNNVHFEENSTTLKANEKPEKVAPVFNFDEIWELYPLKIGKKAAARHFSATIRTQADLDDLKKAIMHYKQSRQVLSGYVQHGSTFFNNWQDWVEMPGVSDEDKKLAEFKQKIGVK